MKETYETPKADKLSFDYANVVAASGHGHGDQGYHGGNHGGNNIHPGQGCLKGDKDG